ncbi:hypothetical protein MNO14_10215 [Luteimonas sp. S4-F44]|uniref:XAC0095 family protein n=1 Tax=Luteimonas sp. S4-F44 TaxID=2925842 RepID=UPI001F532C0E|nr:hypothetical protein [Luteimonas sp. S4-F44]UNK41354.1 hypothetical protein MNO14_10215 [Luteimonas sp. S4-F44]
MTGSPNDTDEHLGYYLSVDAQFRLERLRVFMRFIARLAEPRTSEDDPPQLDWQELQFCMEQLAEQIDSVMEVLDWPAWRNAADRTAEDATSASMDEDDAVPAERAVKTARPGDQASRASTGQAEDAPAATSFGQCTDGEPFVFGLTTDQADALGRLLQTIAAHGDVIASDHADDLADDTLSTLGLAISEGADDARVLLDQIETQRLGVASRPIHGVEEPRPRYGAGVAHLAHRRTHLRTAAPAYRVH